MMKQSNLKKELVERFKATIEVQLKVKNHALSSMISTASPQKKKDPIPHEHVRLSKPRFQFWMAGLKNGDTIIFDPTGVKVTVVSVNKIEYKGKRYSLSGFCGIFLPEEQKHNHGTYEGPTYFSYKGKTLKEIRNEKERDNNKK